MDFLKPTLKQLIQTQQHPKRTPLSTQYPLLKKPILFLRKKIRSTQNFLHPNIRKQKSQTFYPCVLARHQSLLRRKLGESDPRLQEQKIINLKQATQQLNGIIIKPGGIFSLWHIVGEPTAKRGFVPGMLLSNGKIVEGMGGGLCQLSNFLYWIFLHTPMQTLERYHHSMDVFPDSGRTLPFGSGATILYNFIDLKLKNISDQALQLKIGLTEDHLKGQILSPSPLNRKFHIVEKNHCFVKKEGRYFRYNEIYREERINGQLQNTEKISINFAPTLYPVTQHDLEKNAFTVVNLD